MGIIVLLLMGLWVYAAREKLLDIPTFRNDMRKSPMLTALAPILAYAVPIGELLIAYLLLYRRTRLLGIYASLFLLVMFITYLFLILNYSFYVPCACGGIISGMSWNGHMVFNGVFSILAILGVILETGNRTAATTAQKPPDSRRHETGIPIKQVYGV